MRITSLHNPDRYMADLRQVLSQGRKHIGILIGAGAPMSIRVDATGRTVDTGGNPLVPGVAGLTDAVMNALADEDRKVIGVLKAETDGLVNIETILTQVRKLAQAIGNSTIHGLNGSAYNELGRKICKAIGDAVGSPLPQSTDNPYSRLVSWISGTQRRHSVEIFTPNYDLLIEEAFERSRVAYFDGFTGSHKPFFDPASVSSDELPARWSRLWKLHGSLGWKIVGETVIRTGQREATELIYPDHLKYDQVTRFPYSALFERLRQFLTTPDTLFICSGFSFLDRHICAILDEALAANAHTAILAFQFRLLEEEDAAKRLAFSRSNMSVYARDAAIINGVAGRWQPGHSPNEEWKEIRGTFWRDASHDEPAVFLLGDFARLAQFLALTRSEQMSTGTQEDKELDESSDRTESTDA